LTLVSTCTLSNLRYALFPVPQGLAQLTLDDLVADRILHNLPKHQEFYDFLKPILGESSMVTVTGDYWHKLRKMFNPAFSASHVETLVPGIVEESMVFVDFLTNGAKSGEIVHLGDLLPVSLYICALTISR
jgi:cytochrome P450